MSALARRQAELAERKAARRRTRRTLSLVRQESMAGAIADGVLDAAATGARPGWNRTPGQWVETPREGTRPTV